MIYNVLKKILNSFFAIFNLRLNKITLSNDFNYYIVRILKNFKIDFVLDIGANTGQFAEKIKEFGFQKEILSFEPMSEAYKKLLKKSKKYENWQIFNKGFGQNPGKQNLNISKNSVSSSILNQNKYGLKFEPNSKYVAKEIIDLITLNQFLKQKKFIKKNVFIKIDTQGYEKKILAGASKVLKNIKGIMLEASIIPIYQGEKDYLEMIKFMKKKGFYVWAIEKGFSNKNTGRVIQLDIIFINKNAK